MISVDKRWIRDKNCYSKYKATIAIKVFLGKA
jgi:hypothetical protein